MKALKTFSHNGKSYQVTADVTKLGMCNYYFESLNRLTDFFSLNQVTNKVCVDGSTLCEDEVYVFEGVKEEIHKTLTGYKISLVDFSDISFQYFMYVPGKGWKKTLGMSKDEIRTAFKHKYGKHLQDLKRFAVERIAINAYFGIELIKRPNVEKDYEEIELEINQNLVFGK